MPKKITMSDIAEELGISTVTVSKALSGQKGVSEDMRQRIMEIAEERGYRKSSQSGEKESFKIGVLIAAKYLGNIDSFYGHMYQLFSARAARMGCFTMLEELSDEDAKKLVYPKLIGDGNVDAVVIMGALNEKYLAMLDEKLLTPTFYMDFTDRKHQKDSVISGSFYGAYILTSYLFDRGHKDIGYVGTVLATPSITDRYLGYERAMMEHGCLINKDWILKDRDIDNHAIDLDKYIKLPKKMPTAFVCNCDLTATRFISYLKEKGYKVPQDISIVGYDDFVYSNSTEDIGITTYKVDMEEMVNRTMKRILHALRSEKYRKGLSIVEGCLVERDSVRRLT